MKNEVDSLRGKIVSALQRLKGAGTISCFVIKENITKNPKTVVGFSVRIIAKNNAKHFNFSCSDYVEKKSDDIKKEICVGL